MSSVTVAAIQLSCTPDPEANAVRAEAMVCEAARPVHRCVLLPELFEHLLLLQGPGRGAYFDLAQPADGHRTIERFAKLAASSRSCCR